MRVLRSREVMRPAWIRDVPLAHRGLVGPDGARGVRENTLDAFTRSVAAGFGCELDVRLTADGVPVVVHDAAVVTEHGVRSRVARMTSGQLASLGVPTLRDAFEVLRERPVMVELKQASPRVGRLESTVLSVLVSCGRTRDDVVVASFNPWTVAWFARNAPELPRALTVSRVATRTVLSAPVIRWVRPDVLSIAIDLVERRRVGRLRRDRSVLCWTVRVHEDLERVRPHVDNVIFEGLLHARASAA